MLRHPILKGARITWGSPLTSILGFLIAGLILYLQGKPGLLTQMPIVAIVILAGDFVVAIIQRQARSKKDM